MISFNGLQYDLMGGVYLPSELRVQGSDQLPSTHITVTLKPKEAVSDFEEVPTMSLAHIDFMSWLWVY